MKVSLPKILKFKNEEGVEISVDVSNVRMDEAQNEAFRRLTTSGDINAISADDLAKLKTLKAAVRGTEAIAELIVRFDVKWVKID